MASIEKRTRNGRVSYSVRYRDPAGHSRRKVFTRKADATRWLAENEAARNRGAWVDPAAGRERLGEWAERWYATTAALRPTTRRDYRVLLDNQVLPAFAAARLADLDALAVREWLAGLVGGGLSAKRARKAHQVLAQVLDAAADGGKLARNVAVGVKLPKVQRREMHFLDAVQVEQLADAIDPRYPTLVRFAAYTGLRPCELVAMRVGRLDLLRGTVRVAEAAPEVAGRLEWGGVKTHEARTVRLPRFLCDELAAYLASRSHGPKDLVFTAPLDGCFRIGGRC
jgi:integrase